MFRLLFPLVLALPVVAEEGPKVTSLNGHRFTLPAGFEIELAAGPPLTERPITIDFDEQGRLYVAESSGSNEKVEIQLEKKPHKILRLEDTDGDGRFDKRTVFADQMMFPEGTMWYAGSLYVAAPPSIWKLTDTNGDGVADQRTEWFQGKTLTGCANDLHGPYLGPDGWIYWCKGAFAKQTYMRADGTEWSTRASHVFRARPDGSGIEAVMTGGMDNPVDLAFLSNGERIVSNTFIVDPAGGQRDGLIHAVYGGIYGKLHDPLYEHAWSGPQLMPVLSHLGPAAACGLHCYQSPQFGVEYFNNLFTCCFNMRKVTRTMLTPKGAGYASRDEDWLTSDHVDFHPTDVTEDADGSLLVVDTGGWYKLCCPTSQIEKPDVLGGIYRIRRTGAAKVEDPRGKEISWSKWSPEKLVKLLGDPRPAVQRQAMEQVASKGAASLTALEDALSEPSATMRRNAYWTLCRIDDPDARRIASRGTSDAEPDVRQVAGHVASLWRDTAGAGLLVRGAAANQRIAAEVAGRSGGEEEFHALLATFSKTREPGAEIDRELDHSLLFGMMEIAGRNPQLVQKLSIDVRSPRKAIAAMTVLDAAKSDRLKPRDVLSALTSDHEQLRDVAFWILARHPEWGEHVVAHFKTQLAEQQPHPQFEDQLARLATSADVQQLMSNALADAAATNAAKSIVLRAMAKWNAPQVPPSWHVAIARYMTSNDQDADAQAVSTARALTREKQPSAELNAALLKVAANEKLAPAVRLLALSSISGGLPDGNHFAFVRKQLFEKESLQRSLAGEILAKSKLSTGQLVQLAEDLQQVGPLEADALLKACEQTSDDPVGLRIVASLQESKLKDSIPAGVLRQRLKKFGPQVQQQADALYAELDAAAGQQKERLETLLKSLPPGDVRRGQQVFHGTKAQCSQCHAIGYAGGTVGPDMTRIGLVRTERDLLESLLFPSNSFVQGYEPATVELEDGRVLNGLLRKPSPDAWQVITGVNQVVRIAPDEVAEVSLGKVSVMPAGLDQQLTVEQIADLLAYLKACR